ncbi:Protein PLASTID REDOX INSENSITIVE 2, chloroplastic [Stylosanthes scabra]|uniref:Protein PLASTID REDOX INSENSITIVE 2, chloroplastic n=1 Tax=Stylosanthes scabra TaxID=79078 RepID=A0ABU6VAQ6_9FABA|nr:Protein PLASTID REDOX INSENSITIVE 2, chloroplastic [Stylosanthes scabra]
MALATAKWLTPFFPPPSPSPSPSSFPSSGSLWFFTRGTTSRSNQFLSANQKFPTLLLSSPNRRFTARYSEYKFPDPIPEFADAETEKFRNHLLQKLSKPSKKDTYGESVEEVVGVCTEIFSTFLHSEYGGPGTLLVIPFIDMADAVSERGLPGGPQAARAAVKWAQSNVDKDWREWNGGDSN